jgi:DNA primase
VDAVEEIKGRIGIDDVVGRYVELKRSGASFKGLCPFHGEKTPSFYVTPSRGMYKCFGCGKSGDIFTFLEEMEHVDFPEALRRLAEEAGVQLPERGTVKPSRKALLYEINEEAARFFASALQSSQGERARAYLTRRQFGDAAVSAFGLGYAPAGRETLAGHLRSHGYDDEAIGAAGLSFVDDDAPPRDRFRARLMFPIRDASNRVVGFGARALGDEVPKYLNSPQTEIFDKSAVLFGIHRAAGAIKESGRAVLVEGYLDAVRAHISGFGNVVASLGTSVTVQQLAALGRLTETVIIALDPDPAGRSAAARTAITSLGEYGRVRASRGNDGRMFDLRVALLPSDGGDPDELIRDHPDRWTDTLSASVPAFDFFYDVTMERLDKTSDGWRERALDLLLPLIMRFPATPAWQGAQVQRLSLDTGIDPRNLQNSLPSARAPSRNRTAGDVKIPAAPPILAKGLTADTVDIVERWILALALQSLMIPDENVPALQNRQWKHREYGQIIAALIDWQPRGNYDYEMFRETLSPAAAEVADSLRNETVPVPPDDRLVAALDTGLARVRLLSLRDELKTLQALLPEMDEEGSHSAQAAIHQVLVNMDEAMRELDRLSRVTYARSVESA